MEKDHSSNHDMETEDSNIDEEEWELVDEENIVVDLVGVMNNDYIKTCDNTKVKLIDLLNSDEPILQLDRFVFLGRKEEAPGTCVLFRVNENDEESSTDDEEDHEVEPEIKKNNNIEFYGLTRKKLVMEQASLKEKPKK